MDDQRAPDSRLGLPRYVRFARSLALLPGLTALRVAVGATLFTASACIIPAPCAGICGDIPRSTDGTGGVLGTGGSDGTGGSGGLPGSGGFFDGGSHPDRFVDGQASDGDALDGPDVDARTGGGPLPAPPFPAAWLA